MGLEIKIGIDEYKALTKIAECAFQVNKKLDRIGITNNKKLKAALLEWSKIAISS